MPAASYFLNNTTGWVVASGGDPTHGTLYHTTDGGSHWTSASVPFGGGSLDFLDANNGWAMVGLGAAMSHEAVAVFRTSDSGSTWTQAYTNDPNTAGASDTLPFVGDKNGLTASDMNHAWVTGSEPVSDFIYIYMTQDGGKTWSGQNPALPSGYAGAMTNADPPHFFNATEAVLPVGLYANTGATVLYVSHDSGKTWTPTMPVPINGQVSLPSPTDFFVWDGGTTLYASHDGGANWLNITPNVNLANNLASFQFVTPTNGWAVTTDASGNYTLFRTTDGGANWDVLNP